MAWVDGFKTDFQRAQQARRTSKLLRVSNQPIHRVVASPLQRCQQTAELASAHLDLPVEPHAGLAEMSIGDWEDMRFDDLQNEHDLFSKITSDPEFTPPGGENIATVSERVINALREIVATSTPDQVVLVVSHGVTMGIALATLLDNRPTLWRDYQMSNAALSELYLQPEPCLYGFNQSSHT